MKPKPVHLSAEYASTFADQSVASVYRKRPQLPEATFDLITQLIPSPQDARILDMGCGTGEIAIPMATRVAAVDAVDISGPMLAVAATMPGAERTNITWSQASAEEFEYAHEYDLVVCAQCLAWFDWEVVFPKFQAALKPSGWLVVVGLDELLLPQWGDALKSLIAEYSLNQDFAPFSLLEELQDRALFAVAGREASEPVVVEQTIDDFIESIHARNGFSRDRMPVSEATAFDTKVKALLGHYHPNGLVSGTVSSQVIWGQPLSSS